MAVRPSDTYLLARGGTVLAGRYTVTDLLAVGGMGSVWLAEHLALKHSVVVKFHEQWTPGSDPEAALRRFMEEARAISRVRHRHVAELYEVGQTEQGEPYLIMERLRGRSLAGRLRLEPVLLTDEAVAIATSVLRGLEAVHGAGILHRDVKPENIFLHEDREEDETVPKLLDFGLARRDEDHSESGNRKALGTPGYMAPEQARGKDDLDCRVDLYATAVTLYEMLSGRLPSEGETAMERMVFTASRPPIPLTIARPDLDGPLADVIMTGLSIPREDRFPTARAFRRALGQGAR
jgi:eukaryotic-like serine/threonine-protein kinase